MSKDDAADRIIAHLEQMVEEKTREVMLVQCHLSTLQATLSAARTIRADEARKAGQP